MKKIKSKNFYFILFLCTTIFAQGDFSLEDINPNSDTYGESIGPSDYLGEICILFFGHEY